MNRPTTIPTDGPTGLGVARVKMRRRVMAALLRHAPDGVWDHCYCGGLFGRNHRVSRIAAETGLDEAYVRDVLQDHNSSVGRHGGEMRCRCRTTYDDSFSAYGREQHLAEALAAGCSAEALRAADVARNEVTA